MDTPASKRRRVEAANATLRRPFRSPLIRRGGSAAPAGPGDASPVNVEQPTSGGKAVPGSSRRQPQPHAGGSKQPQTPPPTRLVARRPAAREQAEPTFAWKRQRARLEEENRVLEARIAKLRDGGERARQTAPEAPRSVPAKGEDPGELDGLIEKWRSAAQQAADELFESSKARVQSMGGLGGIKKRRAEYASLEHDFETSLSSINSRDRDRDSERERDFDNSPSPAPESPTRLEAEHFRQSREEDGDRDEGDDDKEFTMGVMLRSLNIDLGVIGYDAVHEAWR